MVWTHGDEQLNKFVKYLNSIHKTIKFTDESSQHEVNFLDTTARIQPDRQIYTTLFTKPTDIYTFITTLHTPRVLQLKTHMDNSLGLDAYALWTLITKPMVTALSNIILKEDTRLNHLSNITKGQLDFLKMTF